MSATPLGYERIVDFQARRDVAVLQESVKGLHEKIDGLKGEVTASGVRIAAEAKASSDRILWSVAAAVIIEVCMRIFGK